MTLKPRKQPRQARAVATCDAIVEGCARILERDGLGAATTNAIAARAGVSIGSLYQYFGDRDAIVAALIRRERALLLVRVEVAAAAADPTRAMIGAAVSHQLDRPALARLLDIEEASLLLREEDREVLDRLALLVSSGLVRDGESPDRVAAADVIAIVRGLVDAAGARAETDRLALAGRAEAAALGYLARVAA